MITTYLRFANEAEAIEHLPQFRTPVYALVETQTGTNHIEYQYQYEKDGELITFNYPYEETPEYIRDEVLSEPCEVTFVGPVEITDTKTKEVVAGDQWLTYKDGANLDVVGTIYKPTGVMITDFDGLQHPEMARLDGWHVNLRIAELPEELLPFVVEPATPSRVWA